MKTAIAILLSLCFSLGLMAQNKEEIDKVINATLEFISMEKGSNPDWNEFKKHFTPEATFVIPLPPKEGAQKRIISWTVDDFIEKAGPNYAKNGFKEIATGSIVNEFNGVATAFQGYIAYFEGKEVRGINTYQLIHDGISWKICCLTWAEESNDKLVPKKLR
jgi:hypothetical protein